MKNIEDQIVSEAQKGVPCPSSLSPQAIYEMQTMYVHYEALGIEKGSVLYSTSSETVRRVVQVLTCQQADGTQAPILVDTEIVSGNTESGKTLFTLQQVVNGALQNKFRIGQ